jgi:PilZ domain-containing protein
MTKERRQHNRAKLRVPTGIQAELRQRGRRPQTIDLSKGGTLIHGPIPLEAGSGLELRIDLGEFRLAPAEGKVKRVPDL